MEGGRSPDSQQDTQDTDQTQPSQLLKDTDLPGQACSDTLMGSGFYDDTTRFLHKLVLHRYHRALRKMQVLDLDLDVQVNEEAIACSWLSPKKIGDIVQHKTSEFGSNVCELLAGCSLSGGTLLVDKKFVQRNNPIPVPAHFPNQKVAGALKAQTWEIKTQSSGQSTTSAVSFNDYYNEISGTLTNEGFLEHATMAAFNENHTDFYVQCNMFVKDPKKTDQTKFEGYVHNVEKQQIIKFSEPWHTDAASTLRHFENKFFTSKFELIFCLVGYFDLDSKAFLEITKDYAKCTHKILKHEEGKSRASCDQCKHSVHKFLFESSEPVGPLLKAKGTFKILVEDPTCDGSDPNDDSTEYRDLNKIKALCTRTGKEIYFKHCCMGDWEIPFVPSPDSVYPTSTSPKP